MSLPDISLPASSFFYRFWIINTIIAIIFGGFFLYIGIFEGAEKYPEEFFGTTTLFGILSFILFFWKSWRYHMIDSSFSSLKAGLKISLTWMIVWDIFLIGRIILSYLESDSHCRGMMNGSSLPPCSFLEYPFKDFESVVGLILMCLLIALPTIFSITGFYFDRRKNKKSFPLAVTILLFGILVLFFLINILDIFS